MHSGSYFMPGTVPGTGDRAVSMTSIALLSRTKGAGDRRVPWQHRTACPWGLREWTRSQPDEAEVLAWMTPGGKSAWWVQGAERDTAGRDTVRQYQQPRLEKLE